MDWRLFTPVLACALLLLAAPCVCAGVPWVENKPTPGFKGRAALTKRELADEQYAKGRFYYLEAKEFEIKARDATSENRRTRYLGKAYDRYRASADAFAASLRRAASEEKTPNYLPNLYLEMGDSLYKTSQHRAAVDAYSEAVRIAPAYLEAHHGLACAQLIVSDLEGVKKEFAWLMRESDIKAQAWEAIDDLIARMQEYAGTEPSATDAQQHLEFQQWVEAIVLELDDTVRWTLLENQ